MATSTPDPDPIPTLGVAAAQETPLPVEPALIAAGLHYQPLRHAPVRSLAEAAAVRGVEPKDIIKTLVVRRSDSDFLFVLVPGDREISWPKLRALLGVNRLSMPDARTALAVTGYARGTITPFGAHTAWPVVVDVSATGRRVSLGAGEPNATVLVDADAAWTALGAQVADISAPAPSA